MQFWTDTVILTFLNFVTFTNGLLPIFKHRRKPSHNSQCNVVNISFIPHLKALQTFFFTKQTYITSNKHFTHCTIKFYKLSESMVGDQWQLSDKILFLYYANALHSGDARATHLKILSLLVSCHVKWYKQLPVNTQQFQILHELISHTLDFPYQGTLKVTRTLSTGFYIFLIFPLSEGHLTSSIYSLK